MNAIIDYLVRSRDTIQAAIDDPAFCTAIRDIAEVTAATLRNGGKLLLAGNGGSAGDAQHIAGEIVSRLNYDRARFDTDGAKLLRDDKAMRLVAHDNRRRH